MIVLGAAAAFVIACSLTYALLQTASARARQRASLQQLGEYGQQSAREDLLLDPLLERIGAPLAAWAARLGRALTPSGYTAALRRKLVLAGRPRADALDRFLAARAIWLAGGLLGAFLTAALVPLEGPMRWGLAGLIALAGALAPRAALDRAAGERQEAIRGSLSNVVDQLAISVEAGFGLDQALDRVSSEGSGPLFEELRRLHGDMRAGASRAAAMRALVDRTDVAELRTFVSAVLQSDSFGVPIAPILRAQSEEMRIRRRQLVQTRAQKAPVKMLVPMVFCIFPALFVVVIGPAIVNIAGGGLG